MHRSSGFSESFSYVVQDLIQGFHWANSQATLHLFLVYFKDDQDFLQNLRYSTLSDYLNHEVLFMLLFAKCYVA